MKSLIGKMEIVCNQPVFKEGGKGLRILSIVILVTVIILNTLVFIGEGKLEWFELLCAVIFYVFARNRSSEFWADIPVEIELLSTGQLAVLTKGAIQSKKGLTDRRNVFDSYRIDLSEDEKYIYLNIIGTGISELIREGKVISTEKFSNSTIPFRVLPKYDIVKELGNMREVIA